MAGRRTHGRKSPPTIHRVFFLRAAGWTNPAPPTYAGTMPSRLLKLLFWSALLFAFVMAILPNPPELPGEPSDKSQHMLAFVTLAALALLAYPRLPRLWIGVGLAAFGIMIEIVQLIPALHRQCDVRDWIADMLAVGAVLLVARFVPRTRKQG